MIRKTLLAAALGIALAAPAFAADPAKPAAPAAPVSPWDFAFGAKLFSDYNFRGISQTARNPGVNVYGELRYSWAYAGVSYWSTRLPTRPFGEVDLYAGIRPVIGPVTLDFGAMYYLYTPETQRFDPFPIAMTPRNTDFWEIYGKASWDVTDQVNLGVNLFHAWNWLGTGSPGTYASLTGRVKLPNDFAVSGEVGRYFLGTSTIPGPAFRLVDYTYWNLGVSYTWREAVTLDLRYHGTTLNNAQCFTNTADPRGYSFGATPGRSSWCGHSVIATLSVDLQTSKLPLR